MYGRLTTKEIKKKHSSTPVGGAETGSRVERTQGKAAAGGPSEVVGCGTEQARLQLVGETAAGGPGNRLSGQPRAPAQGNKASNL